MLRIASTVQSCYPVETKDLNPRWPTTIFAAWIICINNEKDVGTCMRIGFNKHNNLSQDMNSGDPENDGDVELGRLLSLVSDKGLKALDLAELDSLRILLEAKSYSDKKAVKSKVKLLKEINQAFYDRHRPRRWL